MPKGERTITIGIGEGIEVVATGSTIDLTSRDFAGHAIRQFRKDARDDRVRTVEVESLLDAGFIKYKDGGI